MKSLEKLSINFSYNKIISIGLFYLFFMTNNNLHNLKELILDFS